MQQKFTLLVAIRTDINHSRPLVSILVDTKGKKLKYRHGLDVSTAQLLLFPNFQFQHQVYTQ